MDWDEYKRTCDRPHVWSRWMLEQTLEIVQAGSAGPERARLADALRGALAGSPLGKPADHRGGPLTDMFALDLPSDQVALAHALVAAAAGSGATTSGTRARGLGGFVEAWREYRDAAA